MLAAKYSSHRGFTLIEMMIALAVGLVVIGAAAELFSRGLDATWMVSQRAEMQQDGRAASDLLTRDISLAGAGLQTGIGLAAGTAISPKFGCDQTTCYVNNGAGINYPAAAGIPTIYGIIPGYQQGRIIDAAKGPTDSITVVYADTNFLLNCYQATVATSTTLTLVDPTALNPPGTYAPPCSTTTVPPVLPQLATDPAVGLKLGDVVMFSGKDPVTGSTVSVIGEVTNATGGASPFTVTFANNDALQLNQTAAASGSFANIVGANGILTRLQVITYYLDVPASTGLPTLMRQVNGQAPQPVSENVSDLEFAYEIYDDTKTPPQSTQPFLPAGATPSLIKKVDILHMTMRSALPGVKGYQGMDLQTSVSARNLGIKDQFPLN